MNCLEVEELVQTSVKDSLETMSTGSYLDDRVTVVKKLVETLEENASWVESYELTGAVFVPSFHDEQSNTLLASVKKVSKSGRLLLWVSCTLKKLEHHQHPSSSQEGAWRTMKIPVDVPQIHVRSILSSKIPRDDLYIF